MKFSEENIDKIFKDGLENTEITMSGPDEFWHRINPEKRDRRGWFLFLIGFGVFLISTFFLFSVEEKSDSLQTQNATSEIDTEDVAERDEVIVKELQNLLPPSKLETKETKSGIPNNVIKPFATNSLPHGTMTKKKKESQSPIDMSTVVMTEHGITKKSIVTADQETVPAIAYNTYHHISISRIEARRFILDNGERNPPSRLLPYNQKVEKTDELTTTSNKIITVIPKANRFLINAGASIYMTTENIQSGASEQSQLFSEEYSRQNTPLISLGGDVLLGLRFTDRLNVYSGIEYRFTEVQHDRIEMSSTQEFRYDPNAFINNFTGSSAGSMVLAEVRNSKRIQSRISEHSVSLPMRISYSFLDSKRWTINMISGVGYNIYRKVYGYQLDSNLNWEDGTSSQKLDISYSVGLDFRYRIRNKKIIITPVMEWTSFQLDEQSRSKVKRRMLGLRVALGL